MQEAADKIYKILIKQNPSPRTELNFNNEYECFVAVVLSPQCLDKTVNKVTPAFYKKYKNFAALAKADPAEVAQQIKSINFYNNKARYLVESAKIIVSEFKGYLPNSFEKLITLKGVSHKVAQVLLVEIFNEPAAPVDTHIFRGINRIFGCGFKNPLQTERFIKENFKKECLNNLHRLLVLHGRYVCKSQNPKCDECVLKGECQNVCR